MHRKNSKPTGGGGEGVELFEGTVWYLPTKGNETCMLSIRNACKTKSKNLRIRKKKIKAFSSTSEPWPESSSHLATSQGNCIRKCGAPDYPNKVTVHSANVNK